MKALCVGILCILISVKVLSQENDTKLNEFGFLMAMGIDRRVDHNIYYGRSPHPIGTNKFRDGILFFKTELNYRTNYLLGAVSFGYHAFNRLNTNTQIIVGFSTPKHRNKVKAYPFLTMGFSSIQFGNKKYRVDDAPYYYTGVGGRVYFKRVMFDLTVISYNRNYVHQSPTDPCSCAHYMTMFSFGYFIPVIKIR